MRRITAFLSALAIFIGILGQSVIAAGNLVDEDKNQQENFCMNIGVYDNNYNSDDKITRGMFTEILANICGIEIVKAEQDKWSDFVTGKNENVDTNILFDDVDSSYPYYSSIKAIVEAGYMRGISKNLFAPEINITAEQVYKVFLDMIGYQTFAEQYASYTALAESLGVTSGVTTDSKGYVTYAQLAKIIYNFLDVNCIKVVFGYPSSLEKDEDETFMTYIMKIKKVKGFLTDNGYTAIDGESDISENYIKVKDVTAQVGENTEYVRDYIGREVTMYYKYTGDEDENTVVYASLVNNSDIKTFDVKDFSDYTGKSIQYYSETGRLKNISLADCQYMIYNNQMRKTFNKSTFDFYDGEITVIPKTSGGDSLIVIKSVEYAYVSSVDKSNEIIYNKLDGSDKVIDLSKAENAVILSASGEKKTINDISKGNVLEIVKNDSRIQLTISERTESSFLVKSIDKNENNGNDILIGDKKNIAISRQFADATNKTELKSGKTYDLYLNNKGEIVWAENKSSSYEVGFLIRAIYDEENEKAIIKVSSMDANVARYECSDNVKINDSKEVSHSKLTSEEICNMLNGVNELIRYKLSDDGFVTYIELPTTEMPKSSDRLYKIVDTTNMPDSGYNYTYGGVGFGGRLATVSDVKILKIPQDLSQDKEYKATTLQNDFIDSNNTRRFAAYTTKQNNFAAEYLIGKPKANEVESLKDSRDFLAVKTVNTILDADDEEMTEIYGMLVYGKKSERTIREIKLTCTKEEAARVESIPDIYHSKNADGSEKKYKITNRDIIRCSYDENYNIQLAELIYRPTQTNPVSGSKGFLAGSVGYYDASNVYSNPFVLNYRGELEKGTARNIVNVDFRMALSWINDREGDVFRVTTQDLGVPGAIYEENNDKYMVDVLKLNVSNMIYIKYKNGKIKEMRTATESDIRTYEDNKENCSKILHNWYWGTGFHAFLINDED